MTEARPAMNWLRIAMLPITVVIFGGTVGSARGDAVESAGDVLFYAMPLTGGALTLTHRDGQGTLQFAESLALSQSVTYGLQYTIHETRPNGKPHSFPSGHASMTFTSAEFIRKRYGWKFGAPCYAAAAFVDYSRVESGNHWPRDVIAGSAIGIVSSYIFTRPWHGWDIKAKADRGVYGLAFGRNW